MLSRCTSSNGRCWAQIFIYIEGTVACGGDPRKCCCAFDTPLSSMSMKLPAESPIGADKSNAVCDATPLYMFSVQKHFHLDIVVWSVRSELKTRNQVSVRWEPSSLRGLGISEFSQLVIDWQCTSMFPLLWQSSNGKTVGLVCRHQNRFEIAWAHRYLATRTQLVRYVWCVQLGIVDHAVQKLSATAPMWLFDK